MKALIKKTVLSLVLAAGLNMHATNLNVVVGDDYTLTVSTNNDPNGTTFKIIDTQGAILYNEVLTSKNRTFSLGKLPNATYTLRMEGTYSLETKTMIKADGGLRIADRSLDFIFKPAIKATEGRARMLMTNPAEKTVWFSVVDSKGNKVASFTSKDLIIKKSFDFEAATDTEYVLHTQIGADRFTQVLY